MPLDERLLAEGSGPLLRFYSFTPPAVSCGRGQDLGRTAEAMELARRGWELVRRPTGGGALLHRGDLTFSLLLPPSIARDPRGAYAIAGGIVSATVARISGAALGPPPRQKAGPLGPVCFLGGHAGEVFQAEGKSAGIALRWTRRGSLTQVSLLLEDNADEASACIIPPAGISRAAFAAALRRRSLPLASLMHAVPPIDEIRETIAEEARRIVPFQV